MSLKASSGPTIEPDSVDSSPPVEAIFTRRQIDILELIASGLRDKELAAQLSMSTSTVHTHIQRMFKRFGVRSRSALVFRWLACRHVGTPSLAPLIDLNKRRTRTVAEYGDLHNTPSAPKVDSTENRRRSRLGTGASPERRVTESSE
jgi:DNA-binding CsgD family transcriptional regulator